MAKLYFNNVLLPEFPEDILIQYPYAFIRENQTSGYYDLVFATQPYVWDIDDREIAIEDTTLIQPWYRIEISTAANASVWVFNKDATGTFGIDATRPVFWTNHDIFWKDYQGSIFYRATLPQTADYENYYAVKKSDIIAAADAIREKLNESEGIEFKEFPNKIRSIQSVQPEEPNIVYDTFEWDSYDYEDKTLATNIYSNDGEEHIWFKVADYTHPMTYNELRNYGSYKVKSNDNSFDLIEGVFSNVFDNPNDGSVIIFRDNSKDEGHYYYLFTRSEENIPIAFLVEEANTVHVGSVFGIPGNITFPTSGFYARASGTQESYSKYTLKFGREINEL